MIVKKKYTTPKLNICLWKGKQYQGSEQKKYGMGMRLNEVLNTDGMVAIWLYSKYSK